MEIFVICRNVVRNFLYRKLIDKAGPGKIDFLLDVSVSAVYN